MKITIRITIAFFLMASVLFGIPGCGGDGGGGGSNILVTLTGQVAISDADANLAVPPQLRGATKSIKPKFATTAQAVLPNAAVTLFQINADGTEEEVDIGSVTTDSSGDYTIEDVPVATGGTGEPGDFYYEVRVASGDLTVQSPTAPTEDTTVNVSPETHLAALMLTDVQDVEGEVLPREDVIEDLREVVLDEVGEDLADSVDLPSLTDDEEFIIAATAIGSDNGNSEKALRVFEAEKEALSLEGDEADAEAVGSYLERVNRQGCNFNSEFNLPEAARDAMAESFIDDMTFSPQEIVSAYNENNGDDPDADLDDAIGEFDGTLADIDTAIDDGTPIDEDDQIGLFVRRDLTEDSFDSSTELAVDQAMAFVSGLFEQDCQPGSFDMVGLVSDLTESDIVSDPAIVDRQIYHDMMTSCSGDAGHLVAEVQVYTVSDQAPSAIVNGVTLTRDGETKSLTQVGANGVFTRWRRYIQQGDADFSAAFDCVTLPSDPEYTISVDLEGATDISETVTAHHRSVPEASISFVDAEGNETSLGNDSVTPTDSPRPIFKWSPPPGTPDDSVVEDAPEGSEIKFTFELSHVITQAALNSWFDPGSVNEGPLPDCAMGGSDQKLMDRNYFIADSDCDPAACLAILQATPTITFNNNDGQQVTRNTSEIQQSDIACRTNVATFLVDENDRYLGVGAGNFRFYCYDSNGDGDCGE